MILTHGELRINIIIIIYFGYGILIIYDNDYYCILLSVNTNIALLYKQSG